MDQFNRASGRVEGAIYGVGAKREYPVGIVGPSWVSNFIFLYVRFEVERRGGRRGALRGGP